ncbi:MAG: T9SS type A sorting domain-containing protein [Saprospirales bacterium]|nr:T9SS type A sorting domain-containing protein [Saprospirales bacterium]
MEKLKENGIRVVVLSPDASNEAALAWQQQVAESTGGLLLDWEDPYWHEAVVRLYCPEMDNATQKTVVSAGLSIFPNPARETATIQSPAGPLGLIQIWDNQGREIFSKNEISATTFSLDTENWAPGVYWVQGEPGEVVKMVVVK